MFSKFYIVYRSILHGDVHGSLFWISLLLSQSAPVSWFMSYPVFLRLLYPLWSPLPNCQESVSYIVYRVQFVSQPKWQRVVQLLGLVYTSGLEAPRGSFTKRLMGVLINNSKSRQTCELIPQIVKDIFIQNLVNP
jgi:hypothetical protein